MFTTKKKILEEILPLRIIQEVEKWPVLYSRDYPEGGNTQFRNQIWQEIAKALVADWDSYSDAEKNCKVIDLSKKWRNLRDTFRRQLAAEKKIKQGHCLRKKEYVYFKHMAFLLPHMSEVEKDDSSEAATLAKKKRRSSPDSSRCCQKKRRASRCGTDEHAPSSSSSTEDMDEDRTFLMSILPSFKRMSEDDKLTVKMGILKVIKEVKKKSTLTMETVVYEVGCEALVLGDDVSVKHELCSANNSDHDSD